MENIKAQEFARVLTEQLPNSNGTDRVRLAKWIIESDIKPDSLLEILSYDKRIVTRFLWMLSDVGIENKSYLKEALPVMWMYMKQHAPEYLLSFASYWYWVGVPQEMEADAIDYLFRWLISSEVNVTMKSRVLLVLKELCIKYPDLQTEFRLSVESQLGKYSRDFEKRAMKVLQEI